MLLPYSCKHCAPRHLPSGRHCNNESKEFQENQKQKKKNEKKPLPPQATAYISNSCRIVVVEQAVVSAVLLTLIMGILPAGFEMIYGTNDSYL